MPDPNDLFDNVYVKLGGSDASDNFLHAVKEITVESSLHLPSVATIVLFDPNLTWIDDASLWPGTTLEISAKAGQTTGDLFDGEIVEIEPDFSQDGQWLTVRAFDRLHRLTRGRYVATYQNVSDGDLAQTVGGNVGLQVQAGPTSENHDYVIQSNETNLDFLRSRAAPLGFMVFVKSKTLHFEALPAAQQPVELKWGSDLTEFHPRLTTIEQLNSATARGWDPTQKQAVVGQASSGNGTPQVGVSETGGALAQSAHSIEAKGLITNRPLRKQTEADTLAQANLDRSASSFIEAQGVCMGNPTILAGKSVKLSNLGTRFSGTYLVTNATHIYNADGYSVQFSVSGHNPANLLSLLASERDTMPITGPVVGIVTDNNDPDGKGRVKVKFPWLSDDNASNWARVVAPGAGSSRGIEFLPEVNDEVLVDFELGDINYPYVLGGLWNGQDAPPKASSEAVEAGKVNKRVIQTREGHVITLDDTQGAGGITIQDKNGDKVILDNTSGAGGITVQDKNGNKIQLDSAANSLTIQVNGNGTVKAMGNLSVQAEANLQLQANGIVEVKGALIKLN
ncbi:MAG: VgrG-related protein [Chloroflexi bacterium]|nr:VgrG-related protein [Chloroflexota bacterium]